MKKKLLDCTELEKIENENQFATFITKAELESLHPCKDSLGVWYSEDGKILIEANKSLVEYNVAKGTEIIADSAFASCKALQGLIIPDSVKQIGQSAFANCESLVKVRLPKRLKAIRAALFQGCKSLKNIDIPASVETIGFQAFIFCKSLDNIEFPRGVKRIGSEVFIGCRSIEQIILNDNIKFVGDCAFSTTEVPLSKDCCAQILVPDGYYDKYQKLLHDYNSHVYEYD